MSIDRRSPAPTIGRVRTFGPSLHGRVQNGLLTLGNGDTRPMSQPIARQDNQPWTAANTHLVRRPLWTPPPIDPSLQAALAAEGRQLLDHAILSGYDHKYAGTSLSTGWLAFDDFGRCWWYRYAGSSGGNTAVSYTIIRRRFGLMDGSGPQSDQVLITPPIDLGQTAAPDYRYYDVDDSPEPTVVTLPSTYNPTPILVSTTTDGRRSLWMIAVRSAYRALNRWTDCADKPVGFFEILVAGDGSISAQRVKSRAECMGAYTDSATTAPGELVVFDSFVSSGGGASCGTDGTRVFSNHYSAWEYGGASSLRNDVWAGGTLSRARTGAVLAMWYDPDNTLHTITADVSYDRALSVDSARSGAPSVVTYKSACSDPAGGGEEWTGTMNLGHTVEYALTERATITIRDNGVTVPALSHVLERHVAATQSMSLTWYPPAPSQKTRLASYVSTLALDGVVVDTDSQPAALWDDRNDWFPDSTSLNASLGGAPLLKSPAMIFPVWASNTAALSEREIDIARWSNHAIGARAVTRDPETPANRLCEYGDVLTPGGIIAHTLALPSAPAETRYAVSGSWRPVRNEFAASVSVDDGGVTPHASVCWV